MKVEVRTIIYWYLLTGILLGLIITVGGFLYLFITGNHIYQTNPLFPFFLFIWLFFFWPLITYWVITTSITSYIPAGIILSLLCGIFLSLTFIINRKLINYGKSELRREVPWQSIFLMGTIISSSIGLGLFIITDYIGWSISHFTQLNPSLIASMSEGWGDIGQAKVGFLRVFLSGELLLLLPFVSIAGIFLTCILISLYVFRIGLPIAQNTFSKKLLRISSLLSIVICFLSIFGFYYYSMLLSQAVWAEMGFYSNILAGGLSTICYLLLLYQPTTETLDTLKIYFKSNWKSPFFISCYIIIILTLVASFLSELAYSPDGVYIYLDIGILISLTLSILFVLTNARSFWSYFTTRIPEFAVFGGMISILLLFALINICWVVYGGYLVAMTGESLDISTWKLGLGPRSVFAYLTGGSGLGVFAAFLIIVLLPRGEIPDLFIQTFDTLFNFNQILSLIVHFLFSLYFMRVLWLSIPKKNKILISLIAGGILIKIFLIILETFVYAQEFLDDPSFTIPIVSEFSRIWLILDLILYVYLYFYTYLYLGIKMYRTIDPPNPTPQIIFAAKLWRVVIILFGVYAILMGLTFIGFMSPFVYLFQDLLRPVFSNVEFKYSFVIELANLLVLISLGLLAYISLRYPQGFLIFKTHIYRAKEVYRKSKTVGPRQSTSLTFKVIEEYLQQIPPEFFE